jgi:hypothetical protein
MVSILLMLTHDPRHHYSAQRFSSASCVNVRARSTARDARRVTCFAQRGDHLVGGCAARFMRDVHSAVPQLHLDIRDTGKLAKRGRCSTSAFS